VRGVIIKHINKKYFEGFFASSGATDVTASNILDSAIEETWNVFGKVL
jgi:hypothetical protein